MPEPQPAARLLYAEDDVNLGFITCDLLTGRGYHVTHCPDGAAALAAFDQGMFDLCLLDVMLPGADGFAVAQHIRRRNAHVPILFLSAKSLKEDRIAGLQTGADDYITKPFSFEELVLRIEVFLKRRTVGGPARPAEVRLGQYRFNADNLTLTGPAGAAVLTQKEAQLLALFSQRPGQVLRREDILQTLWGSDDYFLGRSLDVFISRLRKHLRHDPALQLRNVPRVGFVLNVAAAP
ncbi:response regulator transcription factor [Hymenobacter weizhouensis]|uniref:response regulator transcription factor n=1 Tax=Hymenobacter sp. YIM 151500-1 TaxID=2987689 RepID=UPI002226A4C1|nr:response regulator transcription factor [Hymenobacter sp. YIM 151500-1]UYZ62053.1 response regulator transcription factor [Hymenobacter sp. YIM 151500-1]